MGFTTVIGVDDGKLRQLELVFPTWVRHKPSLLNHPLVCFLDRDSSISLAKVRRVLQDHPDVSVYLWPDAGVEYVGDETQKFFHPQRIKMLAGFVHVPARHVETPYWLKLDLDVVALGMDDWIEPDWMPGPVIIAPGWSYTKPPDQMAVLDDWLRIAERSVPLPIWLRDTSPLNLHPKPGEECLYHKRICSWCAFFKTAFSQDVADLCVRAVGACQIPVPSQDGLMWYLAERGHLPVVRENMKKRGWKLCSSIKSITESVNLVMQMDPLGKESLDVG